ncbi:MAG: hypothetical protein K8J31_08035 [Anaerolineae bacterium]|nr:hypothetical protein [Anaerolineae bacterium]
MATYQVKDVLETLFRDALTVMEVLCKKNNGEFTSQQFLKHVAQQNQGIYIELLNRCLEHPSASPFNAAHQHIGNKLSEIAQKAGYDGPHDEGRTETDIFDNPTGRIVYRKVT